MRNHTTEHAPADILTTSQAAKLLGISVRTAQLLIEGGSLRSWKTPGGHRRVYRADVMALINQTHPALPPSVLSVSDVHDDAGTGNESGRLLALERSGLIDSAPEPSFDRLTGLPAIFYIPISLFTADLKPPVVQVPSGPGITETPRDWSFCNRLFCNAMYSASKTCRWTRNSRKIRQ